MININEVESKEVIYKARHRIKKIMKSTPSLYDDKTLYFYRGLEKALFIINECIEEDKKLC